MAAAATTAANRRGRVDPPLCKAVRKGDIDECRRILNSKKKVDVNAKGMFLRSALWVSCACISDNVDIVELLLSKGANIHDTDMVGTSCFVIASMRGNLKIMKLMLSNGVDINEKNSSGCSVLMNTSIEGEIDATELLLSQGASINDLDNTNWSALMHSCHRDHLDIVECLIYKGANLHYEDNHVETCFSIARTYSNFSVLYRLRKWPTTMAILVFQELALIYIIDSQSIIDIHQYIGKEDFTTDDENDYTFDEDGNLYSEDTSEVIRKFLIAKAALNQGLN
jgi:ankyrin repeat protein